MRMLTKGTGSQSVVNCDEHWWIGLPRGPSKARGDQVARERRDSEDGCHCHQAQRSGLERINDEFEQPVRNNVRYRVSRAFLVEPIRDGHTNQDETATANEPNTDSADSPQAPRAGGNRGE